MRYFKILFPFDISIIVSTRMDERGVLGALISSSGIKRGGAIYNPKQFLSIYQIDTTGDIQSRLSIPLHEALID